MADITPCRRVTWEEMAPEGRDRACAACGKRVYDLAGRSEAEVAALVEERACVRELRDRTGDPWTTRSPAIRLLRALADAGGEAALERAASVLEAIMPAGRRARVRAALVEVRALVAAEP